MQASFDSENPAALDIDQMIGLCEDTSEADLLRLIDDVSDPESLAELAFSAIGTPHEYSLIFKIINDCPTALTLEVTNAEGAQDKLINWILFWAEDDELSENALDLYLQSIHEEEGEFDLVIHALRYHSINALKRLLSYFNSPTHDDINKAIDIYIWQKFSAILQNYQSLLDEKDEDIGWSDLDPDERIDPDENNFAILAELMGPICLLLYYGYALPEAILEQLRELTEAAEGIDVRPQDDWYFDNPIEHFNKVLKIFVTWRNLDQACQKLKPLTRRTEFAELNVPALNAALQNLRAIKAEQLFLALNNLANLADYSRNTDFEMPNLEINRETLRANILQRFLDKPVILYQDWLTIKDFLELAEEDLSDIHAEISHRQHSGPKAATWERAAINQKYLTAIKQADGKYYFYALPLLTELAAEATGETIRKKAELALLTTLFYHLKREAWDSETCQELRIILIKLNNTLQEATQEDFERRYTELEATGYDAECLSDDSEEESANAFERQPLGQRHALLAFAREMMKYGQVEKVLSADKKKLLGQAKYDLTARAEIHHDEAPPMSVLHDLSLLNEQAIRGTVTAETLTLIHTRFVVAQYRGIHYDTSWTQSARAHHRPDIKPVGIYTPAVYKQVNLRYQTAHLEATAETKLAEAAELLAHQLACLEYSGALMSTLSNGGETRFSNARQALQDFYTKKYDEHTNKCRQISQKKVRGELITTPIEAAMLFVTGPENYNCSTGDTPYHACLYAYGIKAYGEGKDTRLMPRWHSDGKAERPYAGKVYTMLFALGDYIRMKPNHLVSLAHRKEVDVESHKLYERETTFSAYIPKHLVLEGRVLRYPNFNGSYKSYYLHKYGMDEKLFNLFKQKLLTAGPHTKEGEKVRLLLAEHLCAYQEAHLIENARLEARERSAWLIYRDRTGGFSLVPPLVIPATRGEAKEAGDSLRAYQAEMKTARSTGEVDGWLHKKMQTHNILPAEHYLAVIAILSKQSEDRLKAYLATGHSEVAEAAWLECFTEDTKPGITGYIKTYLQKTINELLCLARALDKTIVLESFLFKTPLVLNSDKTESITLLYLGGDGIHGLVAKSWRPESTVTPMRMTLTTTASAGTKRRAEVEVAGSKAEKNPHMA